MPFEESVSEPFVNRMVAQVVVVVAVPILRSHASLARNERVNYRCGIVDFRVGPRLDRCPYDGFRVAQRTCYHRVVTDGPGIDFVEG